MWNNKGIVKKMVTIAFTMEVLIEYKEENVYWWCAGIYGSIDNKIRREQWKLLKEEGAYRGTSGF